MSNLEGAMLSDYLLLQCISRGGVADVYRAYHTEQGNYEVAVKIFRPGYAQRDSFRDYFMTEAEKVGQFDHPNVLPFLEFGEGEGLLYAVTPFVQSGTLDDLLRRVGGKFSAMQALPIVQQLCSAVQYAHERDVIHGNIKPTNVFIAGDSRMLLSDFGVARGYDDSQHSLTRIGWGSAEYAAPEQSLGVLRRSSDIYTLGVLLFRILTGYPPFTGQTPVEVLLKHVRLQAPSARSFDASISDAVDDVVLRAMQKRSDDRFSSAEEFSNALLAAVTFAPIASPVARPVSLVTRQLAADQSVPVKDPHTPFPATVPFTPPPEITPGPPEQLKGGASAGQSMQQSVAGQSPSEQDVDAGATEIRKKSFLEENDDAGNYMYWLVDPLEWSPIGNQQEGAAPLTAAEYLRSKPVVPEAEAGGTAAENKQAQGEKVADGGRPQAIALTAAGKAKGEGTFGKKILPILVVILLLIGLLGALLSTFLFPGPSSNNAGASQPGSDVSSGAGITVVSTASPVSVSFLSTTTGLRDLTSGGVLPFKNMSQGALESHIPGLEV